MRVRYREEVATHSDPESCVCHREVAGEALTGEIGGRAIEPRNPPFGMPTLLGETEGNTRHRVIASDGLIRCGRRTFARQEVLYTEAVRSQICPVTYMAGRGWEVQYLGWIMKWTPPTQAASQCAKMVKLFNHHLLREAS